MNAWRLLDSGPSRGSYNLALDEAVFRLSRQGRSSPTVRFYAWSPPALSVGYFQRWQGQIDPAACRRKGVCVYRRLTGGRAVLHRDEVTYSVVCTGSDAPFEAGLQSSYRAIARALAEGLHLLGVKTGLASPLRGTRVRAAARDPSCFAAASGWEIESGGKKLVGSAQKRVGDDLLQHGSILLASHTKEFRTLLLPALAPLPAADMTSLEELMGGRPSYGDVVAALAEGFRRTLKIPLEPGGLTAEEENLAGELARGRYRCEARNGSGRRGEREPNTTDFLDR